MLVESQEVDHAVIIGWSPDQRAVRESPLAHNFRGICPKYQCSSAHFAGGNPTTFSLAGMARQRVGQPLDLRRFDPTTRREPGAGLHHIRRLVGGYRLAVPERVSLGADTVGKLEADRWVLRCRRRDETRRAWWLLPRTTAGGSPSRPVFATALALTTG